MVQYAPLRLPTNRRLQTLAVLAWTLAAPTSALAFVILLRKSLPPLRQSLRDKLRAQGKPVWAAWQRVLFTLLAGYYAYMQIDRAPYTGGRRVEWVRRLAWWRYFRGYFPARLHKTAELDPSANYLFGFHPHGIISYGAVAALPVFGETFPGISPRLLTLKANFQQPFFRELLLALGFCDASRESICNILSGPPGDSVILVVGGAEEALDSHPGTNNLTLAKRRGFVRLALQNGATLAPLFCFGETSLFHQVANPEGSTLRKLQRLFKDTFGFSLPIINGRGIFQYSFGLLPLRKQLNIVVGEPIECPLIKQPTSADIDLYHERYVQSLLAVYDAHKNKFLPDRRKSLQVLR